MGFLRHLLGIFAAIVLCAFGATAAPALPSFSIHQTAPTMDAGQAEAARQAFEQDRAALVGAALGYITSGGNAVNVNQGSAIARSAVTYNRQLHIREAELIERYADDFAEESCRTTNVCLSRDEAIVILTAAALARVDGAFRDGAIADGVTPYLPQDYADAFLDGLGAGETIEGTDQTLFAATEEQFRNHQLNAGTLLDVRRYYDLASLYGSHGQRGYNDAFTVALASLEGQIVTYDSPEDMAILQAQLRELPTAELQGIAAQIAISGEGYGVVLAAGTLLTDLSGQITNTEMADLVAQNAVDATELGVAMMQEIADKYGRGEPLTDDERWLLTVAVGGGMAATGGRPALNWLRTVQLPRFQRLVATNTAGIPEGSREIQSVGAAVNAPPGFKVYQAPNGQRYFESPGGLVYGPGSQHGDRLTHVLDHTQPNPNKTTHTVFNESGDRALALVDEAWTTRGIPVPGDPGAYVVPMGRVVGTAGETNIRVIVKPGTSEIISAYPQ
ncbi:hypothetical protein [Yoonia sp. I 8.24]|uniref:hypothetical protein n=1 Tax=Yoonia sp. I 8.24 TaxID=1537229 RepID=UPI001EDCAF07|nr:hypothetical protein [Yoonia sp. I 8.24]MCG3266591.1 hypothetical protein [Yoonia sp. I 8.24]